MDHFMVLSPKDDVTEPAGPRISKTEEGEWTGDATYEEQEDGRGSMAIFEVLDYGQYPHGYYDTLNDLARAT